MSHGQSLALAHCNDSKRPFLAALPQVRSFHGHPLASDHCNRDDDSTALLIDVVVQEYFAFVAVTGTVPSGTPLPVLRIALQTR